MEIDVLYRIPTEECSQHINRFVRPDSVHLVLFRSHRDDFVTKKIIWNAASRITTGGIFCIQAIPENISQIIQLLKEQHFNYKIAYFDSTWADDGSIFPFVIGYNSQLHCPNIDPKIQINSYDEMASKLVNLSDFGNIILCLGNGMLPFVDRAKMLGRHVIAFGDDEIWSDTIKIQSIKEVTI
jgi:hypothetical protein